MNQCRSNYLRKVKLIILFLIVRSPSRVWLLSVKLLKPGWKVTNIRHHDKRDMFDCSRDDSL